MVGISIIIKRLQRKAQYLSKLTGQTSRLSPECRIKVVLYGFPTLLIDEKWQ